MDNTNLKLIANEIRKGIVTAVHSAGAGHPGGSLSSADILTFLYFEEMHRIDPKDHNWGPFDFNLYDLSDEEKAKLEHLPSSLKEALEALKEDHDYLLVGDVFSEELLNNWVREIEKELREIEKIPHPAEFKLYYDL